jgi:hypothetical protein
MLVISVFVSQKNTLKDKRAIRKLTSTFTPQPLQKEELDCFRLHQAG